LEFRERSRVWVKREEAMKAKLVNVISGVGTSAVSA